MESSSGDGVNSSGGEEKIKEKFTLDSEKVQLTPGKQIYHFTGKVTISYFLFFANRVIEALPFTSAIYFDLQRVCRGFLPIRFPGFPENWAA